MPGLLDDLMPTPAPPTALPHGLLDDLMPAAPADQYPVNDARRWTTPVSFWQAPLTHVGQGIGQAITRAFAETPAQVQIPQASVDDFAHTQRTTPDLAAEFLRQVGMAPGAGTTPVPGQALPSLPVDNAQAMQALWAASERQQRDAPEIDRERARLETLPEFLRPLAGAGRGAARSLEQGALYLGSLLGGGDDTRAVLEDVGVATNQERAGRDAAMGGAGELIDRAGGNLLSMAVVPGGGYGMIAQAMLTQGGQAYADAIEAGSSPEQARQYAAKQAIAEGIPAAVMQRLGAGGVEQVMAQMGRGATRESLALALKQALSSTARQELPEELVTTLAQQQLQTQIDPQAMAPDALVGALGDTIMQTLAMGGMAHGAQGAARGGEHLGERLAEYRSDRSVDRQIPAAAGRAALEAQDPTMGQPSAPDPGPESPKKQGADGNAASQSSDLVSAIAQILPGIDPRGAREQPAEAQPPQQAPVPPAAVEPPSTAPAPSPAPAQPGGVHALTYDQFKARMTALLTQGNGYQGQAGERVVSEQMAALDDAHPEFSKRLDDEADQHEAKNQPTSEPIQNAAPSSPSQQEHYRTFVNSLTPDERQSVAADLAAVGEAPQDPFSAMQGIRQSLEMAKAVAERRAVAPNPVQEQQDIDSPYKLPAKVGSEPGNANAAQPPTPAPTSIQAPLPGAAPEATGQAVQESGAKPPTAVNDGNGPIPRAGIISQNNLASNFQSGQRVRFTRGAKKGTEATVASVTTDGRPVLRTDDGKALGGKFGITPDNLEVVAPVASNQPATKPVVSGETVVQPTQDQAAAEARRRFDEKRKARQQETPDQATKRLAAQYANQSPAARADSITKALVSQTGIARDGARKLAEAAVAPTDSEGRTLGDISHLTVKPVSVGSGMSPAARVAIGLKPTTPGDHAAVAKAKALSDARAKLMQLGQQLKDKESLGMPEGAQDDAAFGAIEALYRAGLTDFPAMLKQVEAFNLPFAKEHAFQQALEDAYDAFQESGTRLPARQPATSEIEQTPATKTIAAAKSIAASLEGGTPLDWRGLFVLTDQAFGGTQGSGAYTVQDAYEALQLAINQMVVEHADQTNPSAENPVPALRWLLDLERKLPTQTKRTDEQVSHQQFSTPPTYAYLTNWVANIRPGEVYLEPQIGTGSLAAYGKAAEAQVYGNEISERRAKLAESLGIEVTTENADHLHAIYLKQGKPRPDVVVMNPPFSATAGRTDKSDLLTGARHIDEAFKLLKPGGRLVAIVGEGMGFAAPAYRDWWAKMAKVATVRANVPVDGRVYHKFGTDFGTRLLVIDKPAAGEQPGGLANAVGQGGALPGPVASLPELARILEETRRERPTISRGESQPAAAQPGGAESVGAGRPAPGRTEPDAPAVARSVGSGERGEAERPVTGVRPRSALGDGDVAGQATAAAATPNPGVAERSAEPARDAGPDGRSTGRDRPTVSRAVTDDAGRLTATAAESTGPIEEEGGSYAVYKPSVSIPGAKPHAAELVESAAMASVQAPATTYKPSLPDAVVTGGKLSDAQLEQVVRAGQAHSETLPDGRRAGYFIGDGTGVGKGRTIAGIVLDNWRQGRRRAVWISKNGKLFKDAMRDWNDIGGPDGAMFDVSKAKAAGDIPSKDGVGFLSYDTLKTKSQVAGEKDNPVYAGRLKQLVDWLGKDFDGVIAFDEAHMMGNAIETKGKRGKTKPSARAMIGVALQQALPKARIVYVSATGATEVANLSYADRLGLWGQGTPFADVGNFISQIAGSGIAAMEVVARDLKSLGRYLARSISFRGVGYDRLTHDLTEEQVQVYDRLAEAWQQVLAQLDRALEVTGANQSSQAKSAAKAQFWGTHQRFFNQVMTGMQMPSVIRQMEQDLADGKAVVAQLVNTNAAAQERALAERFANKDDAAADDDTDLADLDTTPREALIQYLNNSFPVVKFEQRADDKGNTMAVMVVDAEGKPVEDPAAISIRDQLIEDLKNIRAPDGPLDQILTAFGGDQVAEVTGRQRRVVMERQEDGSYKAKVESRGDIKAVKEAGEFQDDKRRILIFSDAGGTGQSYHASNTAKNQRVRRHYVLQPGWRADAALQGLGRTHRTNQKQPPEFVLVSTNLKAQKRFISSIARRLDQLGALTKGQRQTGSGGLFTASDNLESEIAQDALDLLMTDLRRNENVGFAPEEFEAQTGLALWKVDADGSRKPTEITIPQFLNRLLSLKTYMQDTVFDAFDQRLTKQVNQAREDGTLDEGVEKLDADSVRVADEQVVNTDKRSGAKTTYVRLDVRKRFTPLTWDEANARGWKEFGGATTVVRNRKSGNVFVLHPMDARVDPATGRYQERFRAVGIAGPKIITADEAHGENMEQVDSGAAPAAWAENVAAAPEFRSREAHLITGALLPVWDRLPNEHAQVFRTTTDDGRPLLGREVRPGAIDKVLEALGAGGAGDGMTIDSAMDALRDGQTVRLANGWRLSRVTYSGESRIELKGKRDDATELTPYGAEFRRIGVIKEIANYKARYFVPGREAMEKLTESRPFLRPSKGGIALGMPDFGTSFGDHSERVPVEPIPGAEVRSRDRLILDLEDAIGRQIVVGKQAGRAGAYYPGSAKVQITHAGNLDATAHEVAHALDDQYGIVAEWATPRKKSPYDDELMPLATFSARRSDSLSVKRAEGVAEYLRAWLVNPDEAEARAPRFHLFMMGKLPPRVRTALRTFGDGIRGFAGMSALDRTAANIREVGEHGAAETAREKLRRAIADSGKGEYRTTWRDRLRSLLQDRTWGLVKAMRQAAVMRGRQTIGGKPDTLGKAPDGDRLNPLADPEMLLRLYGGFNDRMEMMMEQGPLDTQGKPRIKGGGVDWLLNWAKTDSRAAFDRDMRLVQSLMVSQRVTDEAAAIDQEADDRAAIEQISLDDQDAIDARVKTLRDEAEQRKRTLSGAAGGLDSDITVADAALAEFDALPQADQKRIREGARRYRTWADATLRHLVEMGYIDERRYGAIRKRNPNYVDMHRVFDDEEITQALKAFKGSTRQIDNPFDSLLVSTEVLYRKAQRNQVLARFRDLLTDDRGMYDGDATNLASIGRQVAADTKGATPIRVQRTEDDQERTAVDTEHWQFASDVQAALDGWGSVSEDGIVSKLFQLPARLLRWGVTHSPTFVARNVIRDAVQRGVVSRTGSKPLDIFKGRSKEDRDRYRAAGGGQAGHYLRTKINYDRELAQRIKQLTEDPNTVLSAPGDLWRLWERAVKGSETIGRMAEYRQAYQQAKARGLSDHEASLEGAYRARGLLDYAIAGTVGRELSKYVPFANAAVQGLKSSVSSAIADPKSFAARWTLYVLLPTVATYLMNAASGNDDEWRQLPAWRRDLFWNVRIPGGWLSIPKPFELGALASGVERSIDAARGNDHAFDGYAGSLAKSLLPMQEPEDLIGPLKTILEIRANRDLFRDADIVPYWEERLPVERRTGASRASTVGRMIQALSGNNVDGRYADHFLRGMTGGLGGLAMDTADTIAGRDDRRGLQLPTTGLFAAIPTYDARDVRWALNEAAARREDRSGPANALREVLRVASTQSGEERAATMVMAVKIAKGLRQRWEGKPYSAASGSK